MRRMSSNLSCRAGASVGKVVKPLADALPGIGGGRNIKQVLRGLCVLHDGRCLALHPEHRGRLLFSSCFMKSWLGLEPRVSAVSWDLATQDLG